MDLQDYTYYFVPHPWLSVKLLRLLQKFDLAGMFELDTMFRVYPYKGHLKAMSPWLFF